VSQLEVAAPVVVTNGANGGFMSDQMTNSCAKRPYETPKLTKISLRPEEAVLGHCKTASGGTGPDPKFGSCGVLLGGCTPLGS
jgi:hypothetical protein